MFFSFLISCTLCFVFWATRGAGALYCTVMCYHTCLCIVIAVVNVPRTMGLPKCWAECLT